MSDQPEINRITLDKPLELRVTDPMAVPLAVAKNSAENGRAFCIMLVLISLTLLLVLKDPNFGRLALLAALPLGAACIIDRPPANRVKEWASSGLQIFTALVAVAILYQTW
jgi:hypothetical protein